MTRKAKLEKALAYAAFYEGRKLAPLHAVLLEAVEALEGMNDHVCDGGGDFPCSQMWFQDVAREALAKIDEALDTIRENGLQSAPNYKPEPEKSGT